ncbi:MAG: hypothetical protein MUP58_02970 [Candidatus Nanohaloarchaeota archaeon QJJ-9]|nr:hypothetical protein [Candidatus Nanohaloarchaeota archaeon QJJ-9]
MASPKEIYKKKREKLRELLNSKKDRKKVFEKKEIKDIENSIDSIFKDLDQLKDGKEVEVEGENIGKAKKSLMHILNGLTTRRITGWLEETSKIYTEIVGNWNQQLKQDKDIETLSRAINRILEGEKTMDDTISMLKTLKQHMDKYRRNEPPAFKLSRHYLEKIRENEENKD